MLCFKPFPLEGTASRGKKDERGFWHGKEMFVTELLFVWFWHGKEMFAAELLRAVE